MSTELSNVGFTEHSNFQIPRNFQGHLATIFPFSKERTASKAAAWTLYRFCAALLQLATTGRGEAPAAKSLAQLLDVAAWGGENWVIVGKLTL